MSISNSSSNASSDYLEFQQEANLNKRQRQNELDTATSRVQNRDQNVEDIAGPALINNNANWNLRNIYYNIQFNRQNERLLRPLLRGADQHAQGPNPLAINDLPPLSERAIAQIQAFNPLMDQQQQRIDGDRLFPGPANWAIRRPQMDQLAPVNRIATQRANLNNVIQRDQNQSNDTPATSPLYNVISEESFALARHEPELSPINPAPQPDFGENNTGNIEIELWGNFCDYIRDLRSSIDFIEQKERQSAYENVLAQTRQNFDFCVELTKTKRQELDVQPGVVQSYNAQLQIVVKWLISRHTGNSNATEAEILQTMLNKFMPMFMIDLLKAKRNDLQSALLIANRLAVIISLI